MHTYMTNILSNPPGGALMRRRFILFYDEPEETSQRNLVSIVCRDTQTQLYRHGTEKHFIDMVHRNKCGCAMCGIYS